MHNTPTHTERTAKLLLFKCVTRTKKISQSHQSYYHNMTVTSVSLYLLLALSLSLSFSLSHTHTQRAQSSLKPTHTIQGPPSSSEIGRPACRERMEISVIA